MIIVAHHPSTGARALAKQLGASYTTLVHARTKGIRHSTVINWGCGTTLPIRGMVNLINPPNKVLQASGKLSCLEVVKETNPLVYYTSNKQLSEVRISKHSKNIIIARHSLNASQGRGIQIVHPDDALPQCNLYTIYVRPQREYRIHVANNKVISVQQKRRRRGIERTEERKIIRSHDNGWVFSRQDITRSDACEALAIRCINLLGLHFGACDIVLGRDGKAYLLEVNTAPGLEGTTVLDYAKAFKEFM